MKTLHVEPARTCTRQELPLIQRPDCSPYILSAALGVAAAAASGLTLASSMAMVPAVVAVALATKVPLASFLRNVDRAE